MPELCLDTDCIFAFFWFSEIISPKKKIFVIKKTRPPWLAELEVAPWPCASWNVQLRANWLSGSQPVGLSVPWPSAVLLGWVTAHLLCPISPPPSCTAAATGLAYLNHRRIRQLLEPNSCNFHSKGRPTNRVSSSICHSGRRQHPVCGPLQSPEDCQKQEGAQVG